MSSLLLPLFSACAIVALATAGHRRLPPRLATRLVSAAVLLVVMAALPTSLVVSMAYLAHAPVVGVSFRWCAKAIGVHGSVPHWLGVPMLLLVTVGSVRAVRLLRQHRALRVGRGRHILDTQRIHVAHSHKPYAVTLPGAAGTIVMSSALLELLDDRERQVVVAHELAHAQHRHDRYLLVAELGAALLPPLRALARRVTYSVERWADEAAARACGDRELVALTLGKVALRSRAPLAAGFAGLGVAARMNALLSPPIGPPRGGLVMVLWSVLGVAAGLGAYQVHHLEHLVVALCPH